jgi:hypothetical protein
MIDGYLSDLLNKKWNNYVKLRFYVELLLFVAYFLVCFASIFMNRSYFTYLENRDTNELTKSNHYGTVSSNFTLCINATSASRTLTNECKCAYLFPIDPSRYVIL